MSTEQTEVPQQELSELDVAALRNRRAQLIAELNEIDDRLSSVQVHMLDTSAIEKPVKFCREVFQVMVAADPDVTRQQIVAFCVNKGVAKNTASTQVSIAWKRYFG